MKTVQKRYLKASKREKSQILAEIRANLPMHPKSAIRLINSNLSKKRKQRTPQVVYTKKSLWIIEELWKRHEYPCGIILKASVPLFLKHLKQHYPIDTETEQQILKISPRTIDRRLSNVRKKIRMKLFGLTKPSKHVLRPSVPIRTSSSDITQPGSLEIDSVSHSGPFAAGEFIYTINAVDIDTTWIERRAVLGRGQVPVQKAIHEMRNTLPFPLKDIDFDNGSEFLNYHLIDYCREQNIGFTRCRPYAKNDQAHIEQKNSTHVRRIFGRIRLDSPAVRDLMNDLYRNELRLYHNFFKPSQKCISKKFVGSKTIRKFDAPLTPFQRCLRSTHISAEQKHTLQGIFDSLDPLALKSTIDHKIKTIFTEQRKALHDKIA